MGKKKFLNSFVIYLQKFEKKLLILLMNYQMISKKREKNMKEHKKEHTCNVGICNVCDCDLSICDP